MPGAKRSRVALAASIWILLIASATSAGCGQSETGGPTAHDGAAHVGCPAPYGVLHRRLNYSEGEIEAARRRNRFPVHVTTRRLDPPVDWLQDPYHSKAFRAKLANLQWTAVLFQAYRRDHDVGALRQAGRLMLDWVRHQPFQGSATSDQAWEGKEIADRLPYMAYMLRVGTCAHVLSAQQRSRLQDSVVEQGDLLMRPSFHPPSNHGLFVDAGLLLTGRELPYLSQSPGWRSLAEQRFRDTFFDRIVPREGMWLEPSAGYQLLAIGLLERYMTIPGIASPRLTATLRRMKQVAGWLVEPDRRIVQIGDTDLDRASRPAILAGLHDRGLLWLRRSGLAVVKVPRRSYLSVISSFHTNDHKHADDLSFDLFDRGHRIVSDTGLYDKDPGRYYDFEHSARAHSALTVDGQDFPLEDADAYGSGLRARGRADGWYAISGVNPLLQQAQGVEHRRLFLYRPGKALIVVDRVRSGQRHSYERYFQLGPDIQASARGRSLDLRARGFSGALYSESSGRTERRTEVRGSNQPLAGWTFPAFRKRVPRWTVRYASSGRRLDYVTTLSLDGQDLRAHLTKASPLDSLRLTEGGGPSHRLVIGHHHGRIRVSERPIRPG